MIDKLTDAQIDWWKEKDEWLKELDECGYHYSQLVEDDEVKEGEEAHYNIEDYGNPSNCFKIEKNSVWFTSSMSDGHNIDGMIEIIQEYLTAMDPKGIVTYEWSSTCSKPRLDAFGGGAVAISKDNVKSMDTNSLCHKFVKELEEERKTS